MTIAKAHQLPAPIAALLDQAADKYGVSRALARAVAWIESRGDPRVVSGKGARGVMQLMPATALDLGVTDALDAEQNIDGGVRYLARLLAKYEHDEGIALAAYNWGPGNVDKTVSAAGIKLAAWPKQVDGYVRNVQARKAEEEGSRTSGSPFCGSSQVVLLCPHCSRESRVNVELEIRR
jgi:soluble lytic murein transglycosylase-like protein